MSTKTDCMQDMCRTCMKQFSKIKKKMNNKKQSIHEVPTDSQKDKSIMELLQLVQPQIKIEIEDNLPTAMCSDCVQKLLVSYEFIEMYKTVDNKFRKMLKDAEETANCNYDFKEIGEPLESIQENYNEELSDKEKEIYEITKYEFEIEPLNIENFEKEEERENDWPDFEDEPMEELSDDEEYKEPFFLNPYSDASDNEWTSPSQSCQNKKEKNGTERKNLDHKANEVSMSSTPTKISREKFTKNRKEDEDDTLLAEEISDCSVSCQQCKLAFDSIVLWKQHMGQHRLEKLPKRKYTKKTNSPRENHCNQRNYECEQCGKVFAKMSYYKNHKRIHTDEEPYLCIECGKSFKKVSSLNTHMLRHKGEKTYECQHCPKKFVCSSGLYGHMMVHTKEKPYVCDICGSAFHMAYQLRKHNLYHDGIKNYQCEYCDMRFVTREKQRRHMRTHTGEKPYRCKYCERAFAQSNDCVKHLRQHLGDNVYQCELCPLRFPLARDLRAHFATHKDDNEETRARNLEARMEEERNLLAKLGSKET